MPTSRDVNLKALFFEAFASRSPPRATEILRPGVIRDEERDRLCELIAATTAPELWVHVHELGTVVQGNLWALAPEAFLHFLPAFLHASLEYYQSLSIFVFELVGALTEPSRADIVDSLDRLARIAPIPGLPADMMDLLRKQQLELADSGVREAIFHERFGSLTPAEGAAVLAFFDALQKAHGADFRFPDLQVTVDRYWTRYRAS